MCFREPFWREKVTWYRFQWDLQSGSVSRSTSSGYRSLSDTRWPHHCTAHSWSAYTPYSAYWAPSRFYYTDTQEERLHRSAAGIMMYQKHWYVRYVWLLYQDLIPSHHLHRVPERIQSCRKSHHLVKEPCEIPRRFHQMPDELRLQLIHLQTISHNVNYTQGQQISHGTNTLSLLDMMRKESFNFNFISGFLYCCIVTLLLKTLYK